MWAYGLQASVSAFLAGSRLMAGLNDGWFLLSAGQVIYLMRVRRSDAPFWDADETRRADFDRRGRRL